MPQIIVPAGRQVVRARNSGASRLSTLLLAHSQAWNPSQFEPCPMCIHISQMGKRIRQFWIDFIRNGEKDASALSLEKGQGMYVIDVLWVA